GKVINCEINIIQNEFIGLLHGTARFGIGTTGRDILQYNPIFGSEIPKLPIKSQGIEMIKTSHESSFCHYFSFSISFEKSIVQLRQFLNQVICSVDDII